MPLFTSEVSVDNTPLPVNVSSALPAGTNVIGHVITDSGSTVSISNATLAVTQSGTWTVNLATESIEIGTVDQGTKGSLANAWPVSLSDGTFLLGTATHPVRTDPTGTTTQPVSLASTTITGTVAVTQSTSPWVVSGTVTANAGTGNFTVVQATGTNLHMVLDSGTTTVTQATGTNLHTVVDSGTITANIGTTNGLALDATLAKLTLAQASTTATQTGPLMQAAVTTAAPTYTTAQTNPLSMLTTGALRTDSSSWLGSTAPTVGQKASASSLPVVIASDQSAIPISGTITATPATVSTATVTSVSVSTTVATLLASRAARINAVIFNEAGTLFVKAGSAASSTDYTWRMTANTELDISGYTGIVTATKSAGTTNAQVTDF